MSFSYSSSQFQKTITRMLATKLRIESLLPPLTILLSTSRTHTPNEPRIPRSMLVDIIKKEKNILNMLKLSIMLHNCVLFGYVPDVENLNLLVSNQLSKIEIKSTCFNSEAINFLRGSVLDPYLSYLHKRNYDKLEYNIDYLSPEVSLSNMESMEEIDMENSLNECFYLLNLIGKGLLATKDIMTFIRYFGSMEGCVLDFNIAMAIDLSGLYSRLCSAVKPLQAYVKKCEENLSECQWNMLESIMEIFREIEKMNEELYIVYYNCYYYRSVQSFAPKYINAEKYSECISWLMKGKQREVKDIINESIIWVKKIREERMELFSLEENEEFFKEKDTFLDNTNESSNVDEQETGDKNLQENITILLEMSQLLNQTCEMVVEI